MKQSFKNTKTRKNLVIYLTVFLLSGMMILASKSPSVQIHAASADYMYLSPSSGTHSAGSTFSVQVKENSYTDSVNAVQADLSYPTSKLQFVSTSLSGTAFGVTAQNTGGSGSISIQLGTITPVNGDKLIGTVTFKALASGTAAVSFKNSSQVLSSSTNQNVASTLNNASFTIPSTGNPPPPPPPPPSPSPTPTPPPSSGGTTSRPTPPPPSTSISPINNPTPVKIPDNSQVEIKEGATVQTTPSNASQVAKVEYYLNDKKVATITQAPFTFTIDTTNLRNGTYKLQTKTFYQDGSVAAKNTSVIVSNPFSLNQFRLQARHYFAYVVVLILLIGGATWYLIQKRGDNWLDSHTNTPYTTSGSGPNPPTAHVGTM